MAHLSLLVRRSARLDREPARRGLLDRRDRTADVVTLGVVDAELAQHPQRRLVLHELGNGLDPEGPAHLDHCPHQHLVLGVVDQVGDESSIDFDQVGREEP
jgi:hypothetical protein